MDVLRIPMHALGLFPPQKGSVSMGQLCFLTRQRKEQVLNRSSQHKKTNFPSSVAKSEPTEALGFAQLAETTLKSYSRKEL